MPTLVALTMYEDNDETLDLVLTPSDGGDSLEDVTALELILKPSTCDGDSGDGVLVLSSADVSEIDILTQTATEITATAYIPASALAAPYDRVWRLDALAGQLRRTALYGPVTVIDL